MHSDFWIALTILLNKQSTFIQAIRSQVKAVSSVIFVIIWIQYNYLVLSENWVIHLSLISQPLSVINLQSQAQMLYRPTLPNITHFGETKSKHSPRIFFYWYKILLLWAQYDRQERLPFLSHDPGSAPGALHS